MVVSQYLTQLDAAGGREGLHRLVQQSHESPILRIPGVAFPGIAREHSAESSSLNLLAAAPDSSAPSSAAILDTSLRRTMPPMVPTVCSSTRGSIVMIRVPATHAGCAANRSLGTGSRGRRLRHRGQGDSNRLVADGEPLAADGPSSKSARLGLGPAG